MPLRAHCMPKVRGPARKNSASAASKRECMSKRRVHCKRAQLQAVPVSGRESREIHAEPVVCARLCADSERVSTWCKCERAREFSASVSRCEARTKVFAHRKKKCTRALGRPRLSAIELARMRALSARGLPSRFEGLGNSHVKNRHIRQPPLLCQLGR